MFFAFSDLPNMRPKPLDDWLLKPKVVSQFTHNLTAALDSFACLEALVRNPKMNYDQLKWVYFSEKMGSQYLEASKYLNDPDFEYIGVVRNLLTHRPFWRFQVDKNTGEYHLPNDPNALDSITQRKQAYMKENLSDFGSRIFDKTITMLAESFRRLNSEYASKI